MKLQTITAAVLTSNALLVAARRKKPARRPPVAPVPPPGEVDGERVPYVSLRFPASGNPICEGTLIDSCVVLTAASCLDGRSPSRLEVVLGDASGNSDGTTFGVRIPNGLIIHEDFDAFTSKADIGLVHLAECVDLDSYGLKPVGLPPSGEEYDHGEELEEVVSGEFRARANVVGDTECRSSYGNSVIEAPHLCAETDGQIEEVCPKIPGRAIVERNLDGTDRLVGVASWGFGCGSHGFPHVYTQVSYYIDWINNYT